MYYKTFWTTRQPKGSLDAAAVVGDHVPVWNSCSSVLGVECPYIFTGFCFVVEVDGFVDLAAPTTLVFNKVYSVGCWAINAGYMLLLLLSFNYKAVWQDCQPEC